MNKAEQVQLHIKDTGSAQVQLVNIDQRIRALNNALHKKDKHSRKGLLQLVSTRRKLIKYLKTNQPENYTKVCNVLGIKH